MSHPKASKFVTAPIDSTLHFHSKLLLPATKTLMAFALFVQTPTMVTVARTSGIKKETSVPSGGFTMSRCHDSRKQGPLWRLRVLAIQSRPHFSSQFREDVLHRILSAPVRKKSEVPRIHLHTTAPTIRLAWRHSGMPYSSAPLQVRVSRACPSSILLFRCSSCEGMTVLFSDFFPLLFYSSQLYRVRRSLTRSALMLADTLSVYTHSGRLTRFSDSRSFSSKCGLGIPR